MFCQPTVSSVLGQSALFAHSYLGKHFETGSSPGRTHVLWTIFAILLIPWLLGVVSFYSVGGFVALLAHRSLLVCCPFELSKVEGLLDMRVGQQKFRIVRTDFARRHSQAEPNLRRVKIPAQKRTFPILLIIQETMQVMKLGLKEMASTSMKAAEQHGRNAAGPGIHGDGLGGRI